MNKDRAIEYGFPLSALVSAIGVLLICAYTGFEWSVPFLRVGATDFLFTLDWESTKGHFGARALIVGIIVSRSIAVHARMPGALAAATFLSELPMPRVQRLFRPAIELLEGVRPTFVGDVGTIRDNEGDDRESGSNHEYDRR